MGAEVVLQQAGTTAHAPFHCLVSLMLSSQTKDTVNFATMAKLRSLEGGLTPQSLLELSDEELDALIYSVGFHNNKVKFLKRASRMLLETHGGRVPDTMEELLSFPGVGPKMALILLNAVYGKVVGISVDTHVHRISNQLGWAGPRGTKQPEQTRKALEGWMPREIWHEVNVVLVGFGQEIQTERPKLIAKCAECSHPKEALALLETCGLKLGDECRKLRAEAAPNEQKRLATIVEAAISGSQQSRFFKID